MPPLIVDFSDLIVTVYIVGSSLGLLLSIQILLQLWLIRLFETPSVKITYDWSEGDYWRTNHEDISRKTPN